MKTKSLVVILHYNTVQYTDTIYEILKPYENEDYDLLVFDNGSDEDKISKYTTHRLEKNIYFGGGYDMIMQYMLQHPEYDSMMLMSSDIICTGHSFMKNLRKDLFSREDLMLVSPCILVPEKNQMHWDQMHCWGAKELRLVPWADIQCALVKRPLVEKIRRFGIAYGWGNDIVMGIVCEDNNWKIGICDYISCIHLQNATVKAHADHPVISQYNEMALQEFHEYFRKYGIYDRMLRMQQLAKSYKYPSE